MRIALPRLIFAALTCAALLPGISQGQSTGVDNNDVAVGVAEITYRARAGDTLMAIATRFTGSAGNWVALGRLNGIRENTRIAIDTVIHIPADLLLDQPSEARVVALSGTATATNSDKTLSRLQPGSRIIEGMQIETSGNSFVTFELFDKSRISIPSKTLVRVDTLRATRYTKSPRTVITILQGAVESVVSPLKQNRGTFEIQSPSAAAAVRGTHFRVEVLPDGSTAHALFDGLIELERRTAPERVTLQPGYGNVTGKRVLGAPVPLLAAPQLSAPPSLRENAEFNMTVAPLTGAVAYHVQLATDSEALHPFIETRATSPMITLAKIAQGDYSLRVSAVDANGIEGFSRVIPVSLRRAPALAETRDVPSAPWLANVQPQQFTLKWRGAATGFRVQVARDSAFTWLQYNTISPTAELRLPRPPFGTYFARVQQQKADGSFGPFSAVQAFVVTDQWIIPEGLPQPVLASPAQ